MYEELVKRLRDDEAWKNCDFDFIYGWMHEAADAIEELQKQRDEWESHAALAESFARGWIPVTERLPEEDGWYQVYAPNYSGGSSSGLKNINGNMYSAFKHGKWSIEVGYHKRPGCVKAWMPITEPPKEEAC